MTDTRPYYDHKPALEILRGIEGSEFTEEAPDLKMEILLSEAEVLLTERTFSPSQALAEMRRLNGMTEPRIPDPLLAKKIAALTLKKMEGFDRSDELPRGAGSMFAVAEAQAEAHRGIEPVRLFIPAVDEALGSGLYPGHVLGIVGHEGSMKSSIVLHLAEKNVWENPAVRCLFFSLDMTGEMMAFRRISRYLGVHEQTVREMATAGARDYIRAREEIERLDDGRLFFAGGPLTFQGLKKHFDMTLPNLVIVDYLTLVTVPDEPNEFKALRKVIDGLRDLRDSTGATFVLLSQMGRASKLAAKSGQTGSHAFGGSIVEHLLDVEIELVMDEPLEEDGQRRLVATITKNRFGPAGASFEVGYQGIAKRITGWSWRLKKDKKAKPVFGERASLWSAPLPPEPPEGRSPKEEVGEGSLPDEEAGLSLGERIDSWMTLHPALRDELMAKAERDFNPEVHDSIMALYMELAERKYNEALGR
ncbi:MAG: RAD55 family ATPase [Aminivibrio sp.]|jgi:hypothetical protein